MKLPLNNFTNEIKRYGTWSFGYRRSKGRIHAGVDFYAKKGEKVRLIETAKFVYARKFYRETWQAVFKNEKIIYRYCEISKPDLIDGKVYEEGSIIGEVGALGFETTPDMLHLEVYDAKKVVDIFKLTIANSDNLYRRDGSLLNPTEILNV